MSEESRFYAEDLVRFGSADTAMLRRLLVYLKPYWRPTALACALLLVTTLLLLSIPFVLRGFVDEVLVPRRAGLLWHYAGIVLLLVTGYAASGAAQGYLFAWLGQRVMFDIRRDLFAHCQRLPVRYFDKNPVGRLVTRVTNDIASLNELFAGGFIQLINDVFVIAGILVALFVLEWRLAIWVALIFPPLFYSIAVISRKIRSLLREAKRLIARINAFLNENISGMKVIQLFSREADRDRSFRGVAGSYAQTQYRLVSVQSYFLPISTAFAGLMGALILWKGGLMALAAFTTIGTITAFLSYAQQLYFPIRTFTDKFNVLLLALASVERIFTLMDEPAEVDAAGPSPLSDPLPVSPDHLPPALRQAQGGPPSSLREEGIESPPSFQEGGWGMVEPWKGRGRGPGGGVNKGGPSGEIVFDHVSFGYSDEMQALRDVSFRIAPGEQVAVVGATGAGKTTLINLLVRFYEIQKGEIRVGGVPLAGLPKAEIRRRVGVVPQDVFLFSGSLLENLFLPQALSEEGRRERARRIFADLGCAEFLEKLPAGLDTAISERGGNLSAGERQLVAFARLLSYDPEVIVLDEATANIDSFTERLIQRATGRLTQGRTSIIIAHRLSTVLGSDRILVLHRGRLREEGTHEALLEAGGVYAKLYRLQFAAENKEAAAG